MSRFDKIERPFYDKLSHCEEREILTLFYSFRVQSEDLSTIPLIVSSLIERIHRRNGNNTNPDNKKPILKVSISSSPPIEGLLEEIDKHYNLRLQYKKVSVCI